MLLNSSKLVYKLNFQLQFKCNKAFTFKLLSSCLRPKDYKRFNWIGLKFKISNTKLLMNKTKFSSTANHFKVSYCDFFQLNQITSYAKHMLMAENWKWIFYFHLSFIFFKKNFRLNKKKNQLLCLYKTNQLLPQTFQLRHKTNLFQRNFINVLWKHL